MNPEQVNQMEAKAVRWAFTAWKEPRIALRFCEYLVWQSEMCPTTHTLHYQGYVEFKKEYSGKYVKSLFKDKTIHVEVAEKDKEANFHYCTKLDTRKGELYEYKAVSDSIWDLHPIE